MGLIKAVLGSVSGTLADQWKEFFYCDAIDQDVLMVKGQKRVSGRSSNTKGNDNIISNGSGIAVADGQCMLIVEQGKVVEVCAEPGEFTWDSSTEPSIFTGNLGNSILETFKIIGRRISYGGDTGKDQRVYYINTKEIMDNKFGTPSPVPFAVFDRNTNLQLDVSVRCSGTYSFRITNPLLFYTAISGNVKDEYRKSEIEGQLKAEFVDALQPGLGALSELGIRPSGIPAHVKELKDSMNDQLSPDWSQRRGLTIERIALNPITLSEKDMEAIQDIQKRAVNKDAAMAAATLVGAQADAMVAAANNAAGAAVGLMGMGMVQQQGGANANALFAAAAQQQAAAPAAPQAPAADTWTCACGTVNTGKFCSDCGAPKPAADGWTCSCGAVNKGKFCSECGAPKPAGALLYKCDKCGWEPEDPKNPPKFCPECGDPFDSGDLVK